jgi:hypothetical protein
MYYVILIVNCNILINIQKKKKIIIIIIKLQIYLNLPIICIILIQFTTQNNKNIKRFDFYLSELKNGQTKVITIVLLV